MNGVITTPLQFATGDGVTSQFDLVGQDGEQLLEALTASVWRSDWQGLQALYTTPRTNVLGQSETLSTGWTLTRATLTQPGLQTLRGTPAYKIVEDTSVTTTHFMQRTSTGAAFNLGDIACVSAFVHAGERTQFRLGTAANAGFASTSVIADVVAGTVVNFAGSPVASGITPFGGGWFRIWCASQAIGTGVAVAQCILANGGTSSYTGDGASGAYADALQVELGSTPTSYIACPTTAAVTVTDYALSENTVTLSAPLALGASLAWAGAYTYQSAAPASTFPRNTVISQYANSPTILALIDAMYDAISPDADINAFYDFVWNVDTAQGFGLDIWGRIVNVTRSLTIPGTTTYLGFNEAYTLATRDTGAQPFGQAPFYAGTPATNTYTLADDAYRTLILVKALANISDCTVPNLNKLLQTLFVGRGRCYVTDTGAMEMRYVFEFQLLPFELAILTQSGAVPRPAAVYARVLTVDVPTTFGFNEAGIYEPFGQGVFFNGAIGLQNAA
jgi:hypothetical protein